MGPDTFQMGSNAGAADEQPTHAVTLASALQMGVYEVTQQEFQQRMGYNPSYAAWADPQRPVEQVTWSEAVAYCAALTAAERAGGRITQEQEYRLPTEAEWEYCCRAGTTTEWSTGASLQTAFANFANSGFFQTVLTNYLLLGNAFGFNCMHGNVSEWCLDAYAPYTGAPAFAPLVTVGATRVHRGGSWTDAATVCRSAARANHVPSYWSGTVGFRVVLAAVP